MGAFGFSKLEVNLSTRPEKAVGSDAIWERSENALREALAAKVRVSKASSRQVILFCVCFEKAAASTGL